MKSIGQSNLSWKAITDAFFVGSLRSLLQEIIVDFAKLAVVFLKEVAADVAKLAYPAALTSTINSFMQLFSNLANAPRKETPFP